MSGFVNPDGSELVGGQKSGGGGQSLQLDTFGNLLVNLAQLGSSAIGAANPLPTMEQLRGLIAAGQGFTAFAQAANIAAGQAAALSLYANAISKNILIFRISTGTGQGGSNCKIAHQSSDFALGTAATANNLAPTSANASTLSTLTSSTTATVAGTVLDYSLLPANNTIEVLQNNEVLLLPAGTQHAIAVFTTVVGAAAVGFVSVSWVEY